MATSYSYDDTKPEASSLAASAELRANFQAIRTLQGHNLIDDPYPWIWSAGDAADPDHWTSAGTGVAVAREVTTTKIGEMCAKVTSGSATATFEQELLSSSSYQDWLDGLMITGGAWVYASDATTVRLYIDDGVEKGYSDYHTGGGDWEWIPFVVQIEDSVTDPATELAFGMEVAASSKVAYITGATVILGAVKPLYFILPDVSLGTAYFPVAGDVTVADGKWYGNFGCPTRVESVHLDCVTAPTGAALIADVEHYDGSSWNTMFSTLPDIDAGDYGGEQAPDGTYRYRCFAAKHGNTLTNARVRGNIDQIGSGTDPGGDVSFSLRCLQFTSKINEFRAYNEHG